MTALFARCLRAFRPPCVCGWPRGATARRPGSSHWPVQIVSALSKGGIEPHRGAAWPAQRLVERSVRRLPPCHTHTKQNRALPGAPGRRGRVCRRLVSQMPICLKARSNARCPSEILAARGSTATTAAGCSATTPPLAHDGRKTPQPPEWRDQRRPPAKIPMLVKARSKEGGSARFLAARGSKAAVVVGREEAAVAVLSAQETHHHRRIRATGFDSESALKPT